MPREAFVPAARLAYIDEDIRIADDGGGPRYLMEPSPLAKLVQLAEIGPGDSVLDVGCGTGYRSAVLSRLANSVVALESDPALAERRRRRFRRWAATMSRSCRGALPKVMPPERPTT